MDPGAARGLSLNLHCSSFAFLHPSILHLIRSCLDSIFNGTCKSASTSFRHIRPDAYNHELELLVLIQREIPGLDAIKHDLFLCFIRTTATEPERMSLLCSLVMMVSHREPSKFVIWFPASTLRFLECAPLHRCLSTFRQY